MGFDLLLKGGHVIDPLNDVDEVRDVAVSGGKVAAVDRDIPDGQAGRVVDVSGLYVTPGLVDIHMHAYATAGYRKAWAGDNSILPDGFSFRSGVTTMVDVGSSGWRNFEDFRYRVIDRVQTRLLALINIAGLGMTSDIHEQNPHDMDVDQAVATAAEDADVVVGFKSAHYFGPEWISVDRALEAGERAGLPMMVDFGHFREERPYYLLVTERLRRGDITTHVFRGPVPWLDENGKLLDYLYQARERGVIFDVGHGAGSFVFRNAVPSIEQGFYPDSISTDLHVGSMNEGMIDMTTLMSKFLVMGMPLTEVIRASTINPAREIGHEELGHLSIGAVADIAVLKLMEGQFGFVDAYDGRLDGNQRLYCELTFKDGEMAWDWNGRMAVDYRELGDRYGVREVDEVVLPPRAKI